MPASASERTAVVRKLIVAKTEGVEAAIDLKVAAGVRVAVTIC